MHFAITSNFVCADSSTGRVLGTATAGDIDALPLGPVFNATTW